METVDLEGIPCQHDNRRLATRGAQGGNQALANHASAYDQNHLVISRYPALGSMNGDRKRLRKHGSFIADTGRHTIHLRTVRNKIFSPASAGIGTVAQTKARLEPAFVQIAAQGNLSARAVFAWLQAACRAACQRFGHYPFAERQVCNGGANLVDCAHIFVSQHKRERGKG